MRSPVSITDNPEKLVEQRERISRTRGRIVIACVAFVFLLAINIAAQRVAIVAPQKHARDSEYAELLTERLSASAKILDSSQSDTAFRSVSIRDFFNMDRDEAKATGTVMGCDYFVLVRTGAQRRSSFSRPDYYEAFAVHYVVSTRTGDLVSWFLKTFEADGQVNADRALADSVNDTAKEIANKIRDASLVERRAPSDIKIEEVPVADSPAATNLKAPIPYRRIKPDYTSIAFLYDVRATIDIEADVDLDGRILATRIVRWAGYGLEESVEKAVRSMNWRPAMRDGKPLPMRVLLRYNFTKVDKE
ncbi:MAG: energy transducer TonB [Acidobacteriota bacterium]